MTNQRPLTITAMQVVCIQFVLLVGILSIPARAQVVQVGSGSYSTTLPSGEVGPQNFAGQNVQPKISGSFSLPMQTNDFWSSLIYPFYADPHSNVMYADPLNLKATGDRFTDWTHLRTNFCGKRLSLSFCSTNHCWGSWLSCLTNGCP